MTNNSDAEIYEQLLDTISSVWYSIGGYDSDRGHAEAAGQVRPITTSDHPYVIRGIRMTSVKPLGAFYLIGCITGVAVVFDSHKVRARLVGRDLNVELAEPLARAILSLPPTAAEAAEKALLGYLRPNAVGRRAEAVREARIGLFGLSHFIAEHWPALRVRRPSLPGEPEVILKARTKGLRLGGVVWPAETYQSPEGRNFLRLAAF